jgi:predicted ribosomally synthesized peptide with SipW-like signal peptide
LKKILISLLLIGLLAAAIGVGVSAVWTSTAVVPGSFATTSLDITAGVHTYSAGLNSMYPGDTETVEFEINNPSIMDVTFDMTVVLGGDLTTGSYPVTVTAKELWDGSNYVTWDGMDAPLPAGGTTYAKIAITLPHDAENNYMNLTGTITATFVATQI